MSWVSAYMAMSSVLSEDRASAIASLAHAPASEAERFGGADRKTRTEALVKEIAHITAALDEACL